MFHNTSQRENYERTMTQMKNKIKRKRSFTCKSELFIKSTVYDSTNNLTQHQNQEKINHLQIPMLKTLPKNMMVRKNVEDFIKKLKINANIDKKRVKRKISYFVRNKLKNDQNKKKQQTFSIYQCEGFSINNILNLAISMFTFFSVVYFHIISSFQSFLQDFRNYESQLPWVVASQYICLIGLIIKILNSLLIQTTFNGYKLTKIYDISKNYIQSFQFVWDISLLIAILLLITKNSYVFYGILAYIVSLVHLAFAQRIDDMVVKILTISKHTKQYVSLARLLLINFFMAHLFGSILLGVASLEPDYNWLVRYGIQNNTWVEKYLYSIYWATAIMVTVGFGDVVVTSDFEAIIVVCTMLLGCLILSYNISQVAMIWSNFNDYRAELQSDLYLLKRIATVTKIQKSLHEDMAAYLIHSAQLKFQFQQTNMKNIIKRLPEQMKQQFLKQSSRTLFSKISFFNVLKIQTKQNLSEIMNISIVPQYQLLTHKKKGFLNIFILRIGTVGLACNKKGSNLNNTLLDQIVVTVEGSPLLLNPFFLNRSKKINYSMVCLTFCGLATIQYQQFRSCLSQSASDLQFWRQTYDSDRSLDMEWCTKECPDCFLQHTVFNCPKKQYMPLRSFIYFKKDSKNSKDKKLVNNFPQSYREYKTRYLQYVRARKHRYAKRSPLKYWKSIFTHLERNLNIHTEKISKLPRISSNDEISKQNKRNKNNTIKQILRKEYQNRQICDNNFLQVDKPFDFDFYFKQHNPKKLVQTEIKNNQEQLSINFFRMASQNQQI